MGLFRREQKSTADIRFTGDRKGAHRHQEWTTDETIEGSAHFWIPSNAHLTRATVALKGTVTTKTNESSPGSLQPTWRVERIKFLSVGKDLPLAAQSGSEDGTISVPFSFDLRECLRYSTLESGLPPSLDSKHESKSFQKQDSKAAYDISYAVTVSAYSGHSLIASTTEKVLILPVDQLEPPSYGSLDLPGEYFTAKSSVPRSRVSLSNRSRHHLDLAAPEPSPLVLRPQKGGPDPSTKIDLLLKLSAEDSKSLSNLPQQAQIRTQLVSKTLVTPNGGRMSEGAVRNGRDPDSQSRLSSGNAQDCTLAIPEWETYTPDGDTPGFALARLSFLYRHPEADRLHPTFATPLLTRSYGLEVRVSFPDGGGQALKLSLPLQVVYYPAESRRTLDDGLARKLSTQSWAYEMDAVDGQQRLP